MGYPNKKFKLSKLFSVKITFYLLSKKTIYKIKYFLKIWSSLTKTKLKDITLKRKSKYFCLIKSPFVFKKSKVQFNLFFFILVLTINFKNFYTVNKMLFYIISRVNINFLKFKIF